MKLAKPLIFLGAGLIVRAVDATVLAAVILSLALTGTTVLLLAALSLQLREGDLLIRFYRRLALRLIWHGLV